MVASGSVYRKTLNMECLSMLAVLTEAENYMDGKQ